MSNTSILRIELNGKNVLLSTHATQEIEQNNKSIVYRNINGEYINLNKNIKLKSIIETKDIPDTSLLHETGIYKIYSIIKLKQVDGEPLPYDYVTDSIEKFDNYILYRPILNTCLTNFSCKCQCDGLSSWKLELEEV